MEFETKAKSFISHVAHSPLDSIGVLFPFEIQFFLSFI